MFYCDFIMIMIKQRNAVLKQKIKEAKKKFIFY